MTEILKVKGMGSNNHYYEGEEANDEDVMEIVEEDEDNEDEDGNGVWRIGNSDVNDGLETGGTLEEKSDHKRRIKDIDFDKQLLTNSLLEVELFLRIGLNMNSLFGRWAPSTQ